MVILHCECWPSRSRTTFASQSVLSGVASIISFRGRMKWLSMWISRASRATHGISWWKFQLERCFVSVQKLLLCYPLGWLERHSDGTVSDSLRYSITVHIPSTTYLSCTVEYSPFYNTVRVRMKSTIYWVKWLRRWTVGSFLQQSKILEENWTKFSSLIIMCLSAKFIKLALIVDPRNVS
jgi:hypothetical protein